MMPSTYTCSMIFTSIITNKTKLQSVYVFSNMNDFCLPNVNYLVHHNSILSDSKKQSICTHNRFLFWQNQLIYKKSRINKNIFHCIIIFRLTSIKLNAHIKIKYILHKTWVKLIAQIYVQLVALFLFLK